MSAQYSRKTRTRLVERRDDVKRAMADLAEELEAAEGDSDLTPAERAALDAGLTCLLDACSSELAQLRERLRRGWKDGKPPWRSRRHSRRRWHPRPRKQ